MSDKKTTSAPKKGGTKTEQKVEKISEVRGIYRQLYVKVPEGEVYAFIPGTIMNIFVTEGQSVQKGESLCSLHAMKMDNNICSPIDGTVVKINVKKGQVVSKNDILFEVQP